MSEKQWTAEEWLESVRAAYCGNDALKPLFPDIVNDVVISDLIYSKMLTGSMSDYEAVLEQLLGEWIESLPSNFDKPIEPSGPPYVGMQGSIEVPPKKNVRGVAPGTPSAGLFPPASQWPPKEELLTAFLDKIGEMKDAYADVSDDAFDRLLMEVDYLRYQVLARMR